MNRETLTSAALDDEKLLEILIKGNSQATRKVRAQIRSFASNISARGAIIIGPVGAGKSTIARIMALMRCLQLCADEKRKRLVQYLAFDGPFRIDKKNLDWFEEVNLTGLTDGLAQSQLFGVAKGAATHVDEKPGIFEQAMNGHSHKDNRSEGARITGGVVLLDEIGDFSPGLQPLLLSLLTGAEVFRVGGEGNPKYGYSYTGVTIAATW
jgi:transcriptional regulator with AAA-type ATPase domain